jgi:hypothetical protein
MGVIEDNQRSLTALQKTVRLFIAHYKEIEAEIIELEKKNKRLRERIAELKAA